MIPKNFPRLPLALTAEQWNDVAERWAERAEAQCQQFIDRYMERGFPSMREMDADKRLFYYTQMTMREDFPFLQMDDYLERQKAGLLPILKSPRWQALMSIPDLFEEVRDDFMRLYRQKVGVA